MNSPRIAHSFETVYFVNTLALRSIHNVSHAHIISRPRRLAPGDTTAAAEPR